MTFHAVHAVPLLMAAAAAPSASTAEDPGIVPVVLRIDVSALEASQEKRYVEQTRAIASRYIPAMLSGKHGVELVDVADGDVATVTVAISWIDYQASIYATDVVITRPGHPEHRLPRILCEGCIDHMVVDGLEPHMGAILPWLAIEPAHQPAVAEPVPPGETRSGTTSPDHVESVDGGAQAPRRARLGALGWAGLATAGVGAITLVSGGVVFAQGDRLVTSTPRLDEHRDFRPPGIATMAVGGAVLCAGAVMLGVDLVRHKPARTTGAVTLTRDLAAVSLTHRF